MTNPTICDVFDRLDEWRHLPDYQLERRADIYFAMFLPFVLQEHFRKKNIKKAFNLKVILEFPLRHGSIGSELRTPQGGKGAWPNQSVKVDYLALTVDGSEAFLVELKTDMGSLDQEQMCNLKRAKLVEFRSLVNGVICIARAKKMESKVRQKYVHLLTELEEIGQLKVPDKVLELAFPRVIGGIRAAIGKATVNVSPEEMKPKVIYVIPNSNPTTDKGKEDLKEVRGAADHIITFDEFAEVVKHCGALGERFAKSLTCWAKHPAGSVTPGTPCP